MKNIQEIMKLDYFDSWYLTGHLFVHALFSPVHIYIVWMLLVFSKTQ